MPQTSDLKLKIFQITDEYGFNALSLEIFHYQLNNSSIYRSYVDYLNIDTTLIKHYKQIPFIPIEFFKEQIIKTGDFTEEIIFTSSGTSGHVPAKHFVKDLGLYVESFTRAFEMFIGKPSECVILGLLPSYIERGGSSLIYMVNHLMKAGNHPENGFYLNNLSDLHNRLISLEGSGKKVVLFGVTYALLAFVEQFKINSNNLVVIETGGMKGQRKELVRDELHNLLKKGFGIQSVYSEYGMTELLSQAYSTGSGVFETPPWMKALIRDINDPFTLVDTGKTGGINIIDLANINSCSFIATQDLGKLNQDETFEVLGRFDHSDVRGCNLLIG